MNSILTDLFTTFHNSNKLYHETKISFLKALGITLIVTTALFPFSFLLSLLINEVGSSFVDSNSINQFIHESSLVTIFLFGALYAPITEEIAFRSWFSRIPAPFFIGIGMLTFIVLGSTPLVGLLGDDILLRLVYIILISFVPIMILYLIPRFRKAILNFIDLQRNYIAAISILVFGLIHVSNWVDLPVYYIPLFVLPQICAGFVFQYAAVRFSWIHAIFSHIYYNLLLLMSSVPLTKLFDESELLNLQSGNFSFDQFTMEQILGYLTSGLSTFIMIFVGFGSIVYLIIQHVTSQLEHEPDHIATE